MTWSSVSNCTVRSPEMTLFANDTGEVLPLEAIHLYTSPYRIVAAVFAFILLVSGLIGNIMVVIVVYKIKAMRSTTNCYLVSLAISDILVLISATLPEAAVLCFPSVRIDEFVLGHVLCSITVFLNYLGINVSSLSITAFTVERHIAICHPMKAQTLCTVRRAKKIIMGLWTFAVLYCSPWFFLTTIRKVPSVDKSYVEYCDFKLARKNYLVFYMADLILFYLLPLMITSILYGLIGRILFSSPMERIPTTAEEEDGTKRTAGSSRVQVIKMLAVVVGLFAILWLPYRAWVVYNSFSRKPYYDLWFRLLCRLMVYMNSAINPILYNAMSVKFRRAFKRLLLCGPHQSQLERTYVYSGGMPMDYRRSERPERRYVSIDDKQPNGNTV